MKHYEIEVLFTNRKEVGMNLYDLMKERGYTKISFSKAVDISRPTLNLLFDGKISSITTFGKHIQKISEILNVNQTELMKDRKYVYNSWDGFDGCVQNDKEMIDALESLIDLCEYYY